MVPERTGEHTMEAKTPRTPAQEAEREALIAGKRITQSFIDGLPTDRQMARLASRYRNGR